MSVKKYDKDFNNDLEFYNSTTHQIIKKDNIYFGRIDVEKKLLQNEVNSNTKSNR